VQVSASASRAAASWSTWFRRSAPPPPAPTGHYHPGGELRANLKSISHRCHLEEVAFVWELTKETIHLPLGCLQGGWQFQSATSGFVVLNGCAFPTTAVVDVWRVSLVTINLTHRWSAALMTWSGQHLKSAQSGHARVQERVGPSKGNGTNVNFRINSP